MISKEDLEPVNILLVDDIPDNLMLLEHILENDAYYLIRANSGAEALSLLAQKTFALVLLDVQMPCMDGFEVVEKMRQSNTNTATPIIFITAEMKSDQFVEHGYSVGAVDYLIKPIDENILIHKVAVFVQIYKQRKLIEENNQALRQEIQERKKAETENVKLHSQVLHINKYEAIRKISGGLSHNFNNLLHAILGYNELALTEAKKLNSKKMENYLSKIHGGALKCHSLVKDMMTYNQRSYQNSSSTDSSDEDKLTLSQFHSELDSILNEVRLLISDKITIRRQSDVCLNDIPVSAELLKEVLPPLCLNAASAMKEAGEITIGIATWCDAGECVSCFKHFNGKYFDLFISDGGRGIASGESNNIFDPYYTTEDMAEHKGLGLSVVHGLVHIAGGHLLVDSLENSGTTIHLLFPNESS